MELKVLNYYDMSVIAEWRNQQLESLRTPHLLTDEQQDQFYNKVICNRNANARYWGIYDSEKLQCGIEKLIGMCGIENIQWENRLGEISLLFDPIRENNIAGFNEAIRLVLEQGFFQLNLENIFAEVYETNPNFEFWRTAHRKFSPYRTYVMLPFRKYCQGEYYGAAYLNFNKGDFLTHEDSIS